MGAGVVTPVDAVVDAVQAVLWVCVGWHKAESGLLCVHKIDEVILLCSWVGLQSDVVHGSGYQRPLASRFSVSE